MKRYSITVSILALFVFVAVSYGGNISGTAFHAQDQSCPIAVKYIGQSTNNITISSGNRVTVVEGGSSYSTNLTAALTVNTIVSFLNSITNVGGTNLFIAAAWEGLSTDLVSNNLVLATNHVITATWDTSAFKWSTAKCLHYDVVPDLVAPNGTANGGYELSNIYGNPGGTGNVTIDVYLNEALAYERIVTSPVYVSGPSLIWGGTNQYTNALTADYNVSISGLSGTFPGIYVGGGKRCLVRATLATTATTGVIGATVQ